MLVRPYTLETLINKFCLAPEFYLWSFWFASSIRTEIPRNLASVHTSACPPRKISLTTAWVDEKLLRQCNVHHGEPFRRPQASAFPRAFTKETLYNCSLLSMYPDLPPFACATCCHMLLARSLVESFGSRVPSSGARNVHCSFQFHLRYFFLSSILRVSSHFRRKSSREKNSFAALHYDRCLLADKATNVVLAWIWHALTGAFIGTSHCTQTFSVPTSRSQNTLSSGKASSAYTEAGSLGMTCML